MATVTVCKPDSIVIVDGEPLTFAYSLTDNIHAIQWDGSVGEVEYNDGTPNAIIDSFADYQYLVDAHATEKQRLIDEEAQAEADRIAAMTYADKRREEPAYKNIGDQLDDLYHQGAFSAEMTAILQALP